MRVLVLGLVALLMVGCGESTPPAPAPVAAPAPAPDADGDGVTDAMDLCPNTAAGAPGVDPTGCEGDLDADGVPNTRDNCPDTTVGDSVDEMGCTTGLAAAQTFPLKVDFASGSSKIIGDAAGGLLLEVAALMQKYPDATVRIEGYTDNRGSATGNKRMSQQRAEAVAKVLVDKLGITASRVTSEGFGDANPIATNDTAEGRDQNRRVVAVVLPAAK